MIIAFASILQARPSPTFGRPVHLWGSPLDYGPVLLLMPFRFHLTVDNLPSEVLQLLAAGPPWSVSGFRLRAAGIELGRADCRWRVTIPALSVAEWVHSSTLVTFPEAPL